jgi:hypothetical protein
MKGANRKLVAALYVSSVLAIHVLIVWNSRTKIVKGYPDFTIYYAAGSIVRQGMGHRLYDDATQLQAKRQFAPEVSTRLGDMPFNHPPFEALLFVPLTYLPYPIAFLLWALANVAMLTVLPYLLRPHVPALAAWPAPAWTLASLAFFPIFFALLEGQDAVLLLFLYGLAFVSLKKQRLVSAGVCLACGLFKLHLVLPFLVLLLIKEKDMQRRRRILWGFLPVSLILGAASIAAVGIEQVIAYPHYVLRLEKIMACGVTLPSDMPNLRGLIYLITSGNHHFGILVAFFSILVFVWAAWILRSEEGVADDARNDLKFSLGVFAAILVSYHALGYDLGLLWLPMLLLTRRPKDKISSGSWTRVAIIAGLSLLLFSPMQLIVLMRYNRLALFGWALLLCFIGMAGELRLRPQGTVER